MQMDLGAKKIAVQSSMCMRNDSGQHWWVCQHMLCTPTICRWNMYLSICCLAMLPCACRDLEDEFHRKLDSGKFDVMRPRSAMENLNSLHHRINDLQTLIQQGPLTTITRSEPSASVAQETAEHEAAFQRIVAEADACRASGERQCEP